MSEEEQAFMDLTTRRENSILGLPNDPRKYMRPDGTVNSSLAAQDAMKKILTDFGVDEASHVERFLCEVHQITPEEHAEGSRWYFNEVNGIPQIGEEPPGITKMKQNAQLDDRFWDLVEKHHMYDTDMRYAILSKIVKMALKDDR